MIRLANSQDADLCRDIIVACLLNLDIDERAKNIVSDYFLKEGCIEGKMETSEFFMYDTAGIIALENNVINSMCVHPDNQYSGIGSKLLDHIESLAKDRNFAELRLYAYASAKSFYERQGYVEVDLFNHEFPNYTLETSDMRKKLIRP